MFMSFVRFFLKLDIHIESFHVNYGYEY